MRRIQNTWKREKFNSLEIEQYVSAVRLAQITWIEQWTQCIHGRRVHVALNQPQNTYIMPRTTDSDFTYKYEFDYLLNKNWTRRQNDKWHKNINFYFISKSKNVYSSDNDARDEDDDYNGDNGDNDDDMCVYDRRPSRVYLSTLFVCFVGSCIALIECAATMANDIRTVYLMSNMNKMCWHWPFFHTAGGTGERTKERERGHGIEVSVEIEPQKPGIMSIDIL